MGLGSARSDGPLSAANPPSGIPGGYCWLDFYALALAPSVYAALTRLRVRAQT